MNDDREQLKIHIKTLNDGPMQGKVALLPEISKYHGKHTTVVWVIAAAIIGISVASFFLDAAMGAIAYLKGETEKIENAESENFIQVNATNNLGSDDETTDEKLLSAKIEREGEYYFRNSSYTLPRVSSLSYIAGDVETGDIIIEKNPELVVPIASVSKLVTALVAKESIDLHKPITISRSSVETYGTTGGLSVGEKILPADLLYPLLIESSNDAAEVLAQGFGRDAFIKKMNDKAKELELEDTSFSDPSGLTSKNVSTAKDLFKLAQFLYKEKQDLLDITRVRQYAILSHSWANGNKFLRKSSFIGGKNGFTYEANKTTVSIFDVPIEGFKKKIAVVVLKSDNREADTESILRFLEKQVGFFPEGN